MKLVEHNLVLVTDILLYSFMRTCEPAFLEYFGRWTGECLNMQMLSPGTFLGAGKTTNWLFGPPARKLGAFLDQFCFNISYMAKLLNPSHNSGVCKSGILVSSLKVAQNDSYGLQLNVLIIHWHFLNSKGGRTHNFDFRYDKEMR